GQRAGRGFPEWPECRPAPATSEATEETRRRASCESACAFELIFGCLLRAVKRRKQNLPHPPEIGRDRQRLLVKGSRAVAVALLRPDLPAKGEYVQLAPVRPLRRPLLFQEKFLRADQLPFGLVQSTAERRRREVGADSFLQRDPRVFGIRFLCPIQRHAGL